MIALERAHRLSRSALAVWGGAFLVGLVACSPKTDLVQGECNTVNGSRICTWERMSGKTVVAFGATIPVAVIENAPKEVPMTWPPVEDAEFALPGDVQTATGFTYLNMYWEPHGHPPGPYLVPHFDFHFYAVPKTEVASIDCADSAKPAALPTTYELPDVAIPQLGTLVGLCVPKMGMHALPGPELHATAPFEKTMVLGYYHARPIFIEPMITQATLVQRKSFSLAMPSVSGFGHNVTMPTRFEAHYDSAAVAYRFTFSGFSGTRGS